MNMEMHKATDEDVPDLRNILNAARRLKEEKGDEIWGKYEFTPEEIKAIEDRSDLYIFRVDDQPAGCVSLQWSDERIWGEAGMDEMAVYVHKLSVASIFRGQDIGKQIIDSAGQLAAEQGREFIRLDCSQTNEGLVNYYKSLGFEPMGQIILDSGYDPVLFQRSIKSSE